MALSGGGAGGASGNLMGLSPEQINTISKTDILGGELNQRGINSIFDNLKGMALADYYDRLPQKTTPKGPTVSKMTPGGDGFYYKVMSDGSIEKTDVPVKKDKTGGSGPKTITPSPKPWIDPNGNAWQVAYMMDEDGNMQRTKLGPWMEDLGDLTKTDFELQEVEERILSLEEPTTADINNFNSKSNGNTVYVMGKKGAVAHQLPPGVSAKNVYKAAKARGISIEDAIYTIEQDLKIKQSIADPTLKTTR